jgi:hypothetical protein
VVSVVAGHRQRSLLRSESRFLPFIVRKGEREREKKRKVWSGSERHFLFGWDQENSTFGLEGT